MRGTSESEGEMPMAEKPDKITFKYVHSEDLRDLYANGMYGGVTPRKEIYIHFYSERHPIPKKATHRLNDSGLAVYGWRHRPGRRCSAFGTVFNHNR